MGVARARSAADPPARTFRGVVEYDGTDFAGWQVQPRQRTVQGTLQDALGRVLGGPVAVLAAGRTDAGVHALGQAISFRAATAIPPRGIAAAANVLLPPDAAILELEEATAEFHATRDARLKHYRYEILVSRVPAPVRGRWAHRVAAAPDVPAMRRAARCLRGRHDFRAFRTNPGPARAGETTVRTLRSVRIRRAGDRVLLDFRGDGFLHHMVRNLVGSLLLVGRGAWPPERMGEALRSLDRSRAGPTAPARGLTLVSVEYDAAAP